MERAGKYLETVGFMMTHVGSSPLSPPPLSSCSLGSFLDHSLLGALTGSRAHWALLCLSLSSSLTRAHGALLSPHQLT